MSVQEAVAFGVAQAPPPANDPGGQGPDFGKSSPLGLLLLIAFGIAVVFLIRSMSKHLKKVPASFDEQEVAAAAPVHARGQERGGAETDVSEKQPDTAEDGKLKPDNGNASG